MSANNLYEFDITTNNLYYVEDLTEESGVYIKAAWGGEKFGNSYIYILYSNRRFVAYDPALLKTKVLINDNFREEISESLRIEAEQMFNFESCQTNYLYIHINNFHWQKYWWTVIRLAVVAFFPLFGPKNTQRQQINKIIGTALRNWGKTFRLVLLKLAEWLIKTEKFYYSELVWLPGVNWEKGLVSP